MATVLSPFYDANNQRISEFDVVRVPDIPMQGKIVYCEDLADPWRIVSAWGELFTLERFAPRCVVIPSEVYSTARREPQLPPFARNRYDREPYEAP